MLHRKELCDNPVLKLLLVHVNWENGNELRGWHAAHGTNENNEELS